VNGKRAKALRRSFRQEFGRAPKPTVRVAVRKTRSRLLEWFAGLLRRLLRLDAAKPRIFFRRSEWRLLKSSYRKAARGVRSSGVFQNRLKEGQ
jgi:hypothetical protein